MYRLLIVDDEPMICEGLEAYSKQWQDTAFQWVHTAQSARQAWEQIEVEQPDIMITDIRMPHMSGIELLQRIRDCGYEIKVIALSGYSDFEYVRDMARLGIENYLLKPVNEEELRATVISTLRKIGKEQELQLRTRLNADLIKENIINRWMYGTIGENELLEKADFLNLNLEVMAYQPCCIRILGIEKNIELMQNLYETCKEILKKEENCYFSRNYSGDIIVLFGMDATLEGREKNAHILNVCMEEIKEKLERKPYVLIGDTVEDYWKVAESFKEALKNGIHLEKVSLAEESNQIEEDSNTSPFSLRLAAYVLEHYHEDLSLKSLAAHFKGNAAYIGQVFKRDIHLSFSEYLNHIRMEKAKEYLIKGNLSAKEIAGKVGFANITYFTTVFKKETGLSPDKYRKAEIKNHLKDLCEK